MNSDIARWIAGLENILILDDSPQIVIATAADYRTAKELSQRLYGGALSQANGQVWTSINGDLRQFFYWYPTSLAV